jgi:hypothetical protein
MPIRQSDKYVGRRLSLPGWRCSEIKPLRDSKAGIAAQVFFSSRFVRSRPQARLSGPNTGTSKNLSTLISAWGRVWTALRWQGLLKASAHRWSVRSCVRPVHAALPCAAGHNALRASQVPIDSSHSKCSTHSGFSRAGGFDRLCAFTPVRPSQP